MLRFPTRASRIKCGLGLGVRGRDREAVLLLLLGALRVAQSSPPVRKRPIPSYSGLLECITVYYCL